MGNGLMIIALRQPPLFLGRICKSGERGDARERLSDMSLVSTYNTSPLDSTEGDVRLKTTFLLISRG